MAWAEDPTAPTGWLPVDMATLAINALSGWLEERQLRAREHACIRELREKGVIR